MNGVTEIYKELFKNLCSDMMKEQVEYDQWLKYVQLLEAAQKNNVKGLNCDGIMKTLIDAKVTCKTYSNNFDYLIKRLTLKNEYEKIIQNNEKKEAENNENAHIIVIFDFILEAIKNDRIYYKTWCRYIEMFEYVLKLNIKGLNYEDIIKKLIDAKVAVYKTNELNEYMKTLENLRKKVYQINAGTENERIPISSINKQFIVSELLSACEMMANNKLIDYNIWSNYVDILFAAIDFKIIGLDYNDIARNFITANVAVHTASEANELANKRIQLNTLLFEKTLTRKNSEIYKKI